jgi:rhodanese-related sulfurtransferase
VRSKGNEMSGRRDRIAFLVVVVLTAAAVVACSPGGAVEEEVGASGVQLITAEDLHSMLDDKDFTLINVHIPFEGEIPGTDVHIPYDEIEDHTDLLPSDKAAKIVLYCRSGSMSASASETLTEMGYTNLYDVPGGIRAWQAAGYEVLDTPSAAR